MNNLRRNLKYIKSNIIEEYIVEEEDEYYGLTKFDNFDLDRANSVIVRVNEAIK